MDNRFTALWREDLCRVVAAVGADWESLRGGRIFITGGTGFFGVWLLSSLLEANRQRNLDCRAVVLSRDPSHFLSRFPEFRDEPNWEFLAGDIRHFTFPKGAFTHILHGAFGSGARQPLGAPDVADVIVNGARRVVDLAYACGVGRLLFVSSGAVYGGSHSEPDGADDRFDTAPDPRNLEPGTGYGLAKRLAEHLILQLGRNGMIAVSIARCFAFVGPFMPMDAHLAIGNFIRDALESDAILVRGTGTSVRSYLYAGDLAIWLWTLLLRAPHGAVYDVGSDQPIMIGDLARLTGQLLAPDKPVRIEGRGEPHAARQCYLPDIRRAQRELGLTIHTDLETAVRATAAWYRAHAAGLTDDVPSFSVLRPAIPRRTFVVDIDGVIARLVPGNDYALSMPNPEIIQAINTLHAAGHRIILFTARGSATGIDWEATTRTQLAHWGVRHDELRFGKPAADYYIDDRLLSPSALIELADSPGRPAAF